MTHNTILEKRFLEKVVFTQKGQNQILCYAYFRDMLMFLVLRYFHLKFHAPIRMLVLSWLIFFLFFQIFVGIYVSVPFAFK